MIHLGSYLPPALMRLLASVLLHFVWQGLVLAAILAFLLAALRDARVRYAAAVSVLILMIAAPIVTFLVLRQAPTKLASVPTASSPTAANYVVAAAGTEHFQPNSSTSVAGSNLSWLVWFWIAGVFCFSLRTAGGMLIVEHLHWRKTSPLSVPLLEMCLDLQRCVGIKRVVRFCQCNGLDVPAVIGWFRPVLLLPMTVLTGLSEEQLRAVIVHELAHIKRWDGLVNGLQIVAETVLFYHPAVWWVSGRIRMEREDCCDDIAVRLCGDVVEYARALTYMEGGRTAPSLVMAASGSPLKSRVMRLLGRKPAANRVLSITLAVATLCLGGGFFASQIAIRVAEANSQAVTKSVPAPPVSTSAAPLPLIPAVPPAPTKTASAQALPETDTAPAASVTPVNPPTPPSLQDTTPAAPVTQSSYIDSLKSVGLDHLSPDELIAMKIQGVTADYVRELHALGLKPDVDEIIAMRIQGVTSEYVRDMRAAGISLDVDHLIAMKIQGVTPEYINAVRSLGLKPDGDELLAMRIQQITPEYIRDIRALGLNPTADEFIALHIQNVTPAFVQSLKLAGLAKLDVDDYLSAKIQGITPEFIDKARQHGFQNLTLDQLIALRHAGVL